TGSTEWRTMTGSQSTARTFLDGAISVDEITFPSARASGLSLRLYSPGTNEWSIYWVSSRDGRLGPPVQGSWDGSDCRLVGDDVMPDGKRVRATYEWSVFDPDTARWQQAYSNDGEQTWGRTGGGTSGVGG